MREFSEVVRLRPADVDGHFNLGMMLAVRNRIQEAVVQFAAAVQLRPGYANAHLNLGKTLLTLGREEEAVSEFREAVRLDPTLINANSFLESFRSPATTPASKSHSATPR
jgi:Flp pilus assembly protein TadD